MSCGADAGAFDQRLTVQRRAAGQDALGNANGAWQVLFTAWGSAKPMTGREQARAGQLQGVGPVTFRMRYRAGVRESDRVLWRGQPYEITAPPVDVDGRRTVLELPCATGLRDGRADV